MTDRKPPNSTSNIYKETLKIDVRHLVTHGHWKLDGTCSVCGKHTLQSYGNFCCYCGADMKGENEMKTIDTEKLNEVINEIICENPIITYPEQDAYDDGYNDGLNRALSETEDLAVEIIYCKDCKYYITDNKSIFKGCCEHHRDLHGFPMEKKLDDFCSNAKRKETK